MTEEQIRTEVAESKPIPEEPELLTLWRRVAQMRDWLVNDIDEWAAPVHPIAQSIAKIVEVHRAHGMTDRRLAELEAEATATRMEVPGWRVHLADIDAKISAGVRVGLTLNDLRDLLGSPKALEAAARAALIAWLDGDTTETKTCALKAIKKAFRIEADLDALNAQDLEERRLKAGVPSRRTGAVAGRILTKLRESAPPRPTQSLDPRIHRA